MYLKRLINNYRDLFDCFRVLHEPSMGLVVSLSILESKINKKHSSFPLLSVHTTLHTIVDEVLTAACF
jgi:hypothetical protein